MQLAEMDTYINLSLVAGGDMIYTYDELACSDCRQVYLGVLLHENFRVDRLKMTDDGICSLLKLVADRSKFELLRRCARQPSYCQQLSREMGLTTATISRHMSLLLEAGLVRALQGREPAFTTPSTVRPWLPSATPYIRRSCRSSFTDRVIFLPAFGQS